MDSSGFDSVLISFLVMVLVLLVVLAFQGKDSQGKDSQGKDSQGKGGVVKSSDSKALLIARKREKEL